MKKVRRFFRDIKESIKHFKLRRMMKDHFGMLVMTSLSLFDKPEMYISTDDTARLIKKYKLNPLTLTNTTDGGKGTACMAFSEVSQKWYGWSHRAIYGFTIGDEVHEGDLTASSGYTEEYCIEHPEEAFKDVLPVGFVAKTLDDAKLMAKAFASAVS